MDRDQLLSIYSYDGDECNTFSHLRDYMAAIERPPLADPNEIERFCLAGLFLTYRACNHFGATMKSGEETESLPEPHFSRLAMFDEATGRHLRDTTQYTKLLRIGLLTRFENIGRKLTRFVRQRRPLKWD